MRFLSLTLTALVAAALAPSVALAENPPSDTLSERLQGRWEITSGVNQGEKLSPLHLVGTVVTVSVNQITVFDRDQKEQYNAVFRLDESENPAHITMTTIRPTASKDKLKSADRDSSDRTVAGILKFKDDDHWVLCYALPDEERPHKFESPAESNIMLFHLRRPNQPGSNL